MKTKICALLLTLVMLLMLAACSSGDTTSSSSSSAGAQASATASGPISNEVSADAESATVDVVNLANDRDPTDLGPWAGNQGGASAMIGVVYQTLNIREVDVTDSAPCLAKTITQVSDLVYDVELFDYIKDTAGNVFTAADAVFCIETAKELGKVASAKVIESAEKTGDYTFRVTFSDATRTGDVETFFNQVYFVTEKAYTDSPDSMATDPVGTSAYKLKEYTSGYLLSYEVTGNYWQTDEQYIARSSEAHAKVINYYIITEASQRAIAVEGGTIDYAAIAYTDLNRVEALEDYHINEVPDNLTWLLFPNCADGVATDNLELRKAIFYALDNEAIAAFYSTGKAVPVYDISNSNYSDYYETEYKASAGSDIYKYDPELAKSLLAEAGYANGITLRLIVTSTEAGTDLAQIIKNYLAEVGITVEISSYQGNMISTYADDSSAWDLYLLQYASTDYAVNVWEKVLNKAKFNWGGTINFIMSDELQDMLSNVRSGSGHTKENVVAFHDYFAENAYGIGVIQEINCYAVNNTLEQVVMSDQRIIRPNASIYSAD